MRENNCLGEHMAVTQRMLNAFLRCRLEGVDLSASQVIFLMHLYKQDGQSQEEINKKMQYDKGVIARMAAALEKNGYISRKNNPMDNRAYLLLLTQKAIDFLPTMVEILKEWNSVLVEGEDEETLIMLDRAMKRIADRSVEKVKEIKNGKK
ncbi:MAG: MarR family winged helix-turn-helix transcriptional regulator [Eubacteriales bacterium]